MRKLTEHDRKQVMDYILKEPEFNLFFIGDIENFGFDNKDVELFASDSDTGYDFLLLCYLDNFLLYSDHTDYDVREAADFISEANPKCVNGKSDIVEKLLPFLPDRYGEKAFLSRLNEVKALPVMADGAEVCRLTPDNASDIVALYLQIEEFRDLYGSDVNSIKQVRLNLENGGHSYGVFRNGKLVSVASTGAENSVSAMVMGVATLPEARKHGFASYLVAKLCGDFLNEGKQFLCLFYDNPKAGSIYHRIGFTELGNYILLKRRK